MKSGSLASSGCDGQADLPRLLRERRPNCDSELTSAAGLRKCYESNLAIFAEQVVNCAGERFDAIWMSEPALSDVLHLLVKAIEGRDAARGRKLAGTSMTTSTSRSLWGGSSSRTMTFWAQRRPGTRARSIAATTFSTTCQWVRGGLLTEDHSTPETPR